MVGKKCEEKVGKPEVYPGKPWYLWYLWYL